jgi:hypothetical protein
VEEAHLEEILGVLRKMTTEEPLSMAPNQQTWCNKIEKWLLVSYTLCLALTMTVAVIAALGSIQDKAEPAVRFGLFATLCIFGIYAPTVITNALRSNHKLRKDKDHYIHERLRQDALLDWTAISHLKTYPIQLVEYALVQYKWRWETLEYRLFLFSGDLRKLGLAPAVAASAAAASTALKKDGTVLLWAPATIACCFYILSFALLAARERPKQVVELVSYAIKNWSLLDQPMRNIAQAQTHSTNG